MESEFNIIYERSRRSRGISISVRPGGEVHVRFPLLGLQRTAEKFVAKKAEWIRKTVARRKEMIALPKSSKKHFLAHKESARKLILERLEHFNIQYGFSWKAVRIGRQKSRWGSCSRRGTLSFNYHLLFLPSEIRDYVVVHELCHLKEFNHSKNFWNEVARTIPEWKNLRKELKKYQAN